MNWPGFRRIRDSGAKFGSFTFLILFSWGLAVGAQGDPTRESFPASLRRGFDYAEFMRFEADAPPKDRLLQSNGFLALVEQSFGNQVVLVAAAVDRAPNNVSDRLRAIEIDTPVLQDDAGHIYALSDANAKRSVTYYPDRTVYQFAFEGGPRVSYTVYPVYGKAAVVFRLHLEKSATPLHANLSSFGRGFDSLPLSRGNVRSFGSSRWPYRLLLDLGAQGANGRWEIGPGGEAGAVLALGATEAKAQSVLAEIRKSPDLFDKSTRKAWNDFFGSAPLVLPADPVTFTVGTTGKQMYIAPEDLLRSELWTWRGMLTDTVQVRYLAGTPLVLADWEVFTGMWGNDGIAETLALSGTDRKDIARASILNWFRYSVNATGDGHAAWTIFPSGRNTFSASGAEKVTESVPLQGALVGLYVRLTGDTSILEIKPGGAAGDRTVWESLIAYQRNLRKVRDINDDHLIDWTHIYETGWDDKNAPFVDSHGAPTSTVNEQVCNLWSLQEMVYLSGLLHQDASEWQAEFDAAMNAVRAKLWDPETQRYWDLDIEAGKLWTRGENLDAYYFLYYETDLRRIDAMMKRLNDPAKFNGALLPTLAFDTPKWGGYWRGPSWPREYAQVALALSRAGYGQEAFTWLVRGVNANLGPVIPENIDPKTYPEKHDFSGVRIMGYTALDCLGFPDVAGLRFWGGQDLTVKADATLGKVYVRGQKWMGDGYDAIFDPGRPTRIWRNGKELKPLAAGKVWKARKQGGQVSFEEVE